MAYRSPGRVLGPLALLACAIALVLIVQHAGGGAGGTPGTSHVSTTPVPRHARRTYVVRPGDTLSGIAARHRVPLKRLLALNPGLAPHSLRTGQHVRLRR